MRLTARSHRPLGVYRSEMHGIPVTIHLQDRRPHLQTLRRRAGNANHHSATNPLAQAPLASSAATRSRLDLDHLKVIFARPAFRAGPIDGYILPSGAGSNALVRPAFCFIIDPSTDQAHPGAVR
jgi:hypothetical protein